MPRGAAIAVAVAVGAGVGVALQDWVVGLCTMAAIAVLMLLFARRQK